eukprot:s450_g3.t1
MADSYGKGKGRRKGGKKGPETSEWDYDGYGKGYGGNHNAASMGGAAAGAGGIGGKPSKDIVHHYPPKEMAADVGYPVRGGQTLLIAYFPWEASEGDIEREFSKFCRVKRVHLVVDKSSRKPRCFGFVKFLSKADAEEALRATTQGLVQLPDTRGHVWHLKAEWTKSGDMVVDDSEAEQEVAKRKEERRSRTDTTPPGRGGTSAPPPKGALHPGVPAPLPPLQTRYPPQAAIGMPPPPPLQQSMVPVSDVEQLSGELHGTPVPRKISDGTQMEICRLPDVDDETWKEVCAYVQSNPETAKTLQNFAKNPDAMRGWLQTQAIAEHYSTKLSQEDNIVQERVKSLEADPELAPIFEDIKKNGIEAAMKYYQDEEMMLKISQRMGGLPSELSPVLQKIEDTAMTLHEAAKRGDLNAVKTFLDKSKPLDSQDYKGITPLGYAIGANRIAVVKLLLDCRANPYSVDSSGNSGLHYAAGYGRKELLEYLLKVGANVNQPNAQGLTPLAAATQNRQEATMQAHSHAVPPLQQPLPPQGQLYGQHMYGQGQQLYGSQASIYSGLPVPGRDPAALDAPGLPSAAAPPLLRDINSYAQASQQAYPGGPGYAAAVAAHHAPGYPPQSAQSYVGQQPYGSQQPYVSSQQAAYSAGQYSGQQAAYAAGQQAYQTAAATASSGYGGAYPPQAQTGYGAPPGYGAQYGQPATAYPTNPTTAYATAGYGLGQSPYNYLQQPSTSASGVVAYGSYQGAQSQVPQAATSQVQYTQPGQTDPSVATGSLADQSQQQYLDMVWQLSDMSLNDKQSLPAPPNQQPPAPPAHMPVEGTAAGTSTGVWNSFDDAAAKGMVDGLVGDDSAAGNPPPLPPPPPNTAMWTSH